MSNFPGPGLYLLLGESGLGKTVATLQYAKHLIQSNNTLFYIDLKCQSDKQNLELLLKES